MFLRDEWRCLRLADFWMFSEDLVVRERLNVLLHGLDTRAALPMTIPGRAV